MFTLQPNVTHGNIVGLVHPLSGHHIQPRSKFMAVEEPEFSIPIISQQICHIVCNW